MVRTSRHTNGSPMAQVKRAPIAAQLFERFRDFVLFVLLAWIAFPFLWGLSSSLKKSSELFARVPRWIPTQITFEHYQWAFGNERFMRGFGNSLVVSFATSLLAMTICAAAAYSLARFYYPGKRMIMTFFVSTQMLPRILIAVPLFVIFSRFRLVDTRIGMVLGYSTFAAPFAILMLRGFFAAFPHELEEAALVDGANRLQAFASVVLPIIIPGLVATGLFAFVLAWNDLLFAMILGRTMRSTTAAVVLNNLAHSQFAGTNYGGLLAGGILLTLPAVIFFVFLQNFLIAGMTAGATKG